MTMFRSTFLSLALACLVVATAAAAPGGKLAPPSAGPATPTIVGTSQGSWDLPTGASDGFATGVLALGQGFPFYLMTVTLPAADVTPSGALLTGTLEGGVLSFPLTPNGAFDLDVTGTWTVDPTTGEGTFQAFLTRQLSPGGPIVLLGTINGSFEDLELPGGPDALGTYKARWTLF